jgi:hypothetical protein
MQIKYVIHNRHSKKDKNGNQLHYTTIVNTTTGSFFGGSMDDVNFAYRGVMLYDKEANSSNIYVIEEHNLPIAQVRAKNKYMSHIGKSAEEVANNMQYAAAVNLSYISS